MVLTTLGYSAMGRSLARRAPSLLPLPLPAHLLLLRPTQLLLPPPQLRWAMPP